MFKPILGMWRGGIVATDCFEVYKLTAICSTSLTASGLTGEVDAKPEMSCLPTGRLRRGFPQIITNYR